MRKPVIAGNWKMFKVGSEATAFVAALAAKVKGNSDLPEILLCPPFTALSVTVEAVQKQKAPFHIGAQTMESKDNGAYTGEISPVMLNDIHVKWVLVGHSERRQYYNETDKTVNEKTLAALKHGITPVVCVGETLEQREANQTDALIQKQVEEALKGVSDFSKLVMAYEPVWAIGTGKVCESAEANRVCGLIRQTLNKLGGGEKTRVLYGGSVKPDNIRELMAGSDIDGALVGGASLEPDSFYNIIMGAVPAKV